MGTPFEFVFALNHEFFFSETTNTDKKWKLFPNARLPRKLHRTWSMWRDTQPNQRECGTTRIEGHEEIIYIYKVALSACFFVCNVSAVRVSRRSTPRSKAVWRAGQPTRLTPRFLARGSSTKRGHSLNLGSQVTSSQQPYPKIRSPECPESWTSVFLRYVSFGNDSERYVNVLLSKRKFLLSCFPDFSWVVKPLSVARSAFWLTWDSLRSERRKGRRAFFCWVVVCAPSCDLWVRFSPSTYSEDDVERLLFFVGFLTLSRRSHRRRPNPPLTTTKPPHTLSALCRGDFRFLLSNRRQPTWNRPSFRARAQAL